MTVAVNHQNNTHAPGEDSANATPPGNRPGWTGRFREFGKDRHWRRLAIALMTILALEALAIWVTLGPGEAGWAARMPETVQNLAGFMARGWVIATTLVLNVAVFLRLAGRGTSAAELAAMEKRHAELLKRQQDMERPHGEAFGEGANSGPDDISAAMKEIQETGDQLADSAEIESARTEKADSERDKDADDRARTGDAGAQPAQQKLSENEG